MAASTEASLSGEIGIDHPAFDGASDSRTAEMHRILDGLAHPSASEALRTLRDAFPGVPLDERVRVIADHVR